MKMKTVINVKEREAAIKDICLFKDNVFPGYDIFSYDVTGCIDGTQRIKVLNANLTIDSITDINPETNIKFAKDCVLIKCTYIGEGELLSFNDIRYITEDIES